MAPPLRARARRRRCDRGGLRRGREGPRPRRPRRPRSGPRPRRQALGRSRSSAGSAWRAPRGLDAAHAGAGDPTRVRVLLPAGYGSDPRRRYPVLYLLHGAESDYRSWTRYGDAQAITAARPDDRRHARRRGGGLVHRLVQGGRPVQPRWETYHVGELVPWIDATYRTIAARRGRAIAGLSMGGFGALSYAARHPGTFAAAASFSGALEVGSADAWGQRSANAARWRAHLPISIAARLRSLALVELRTGDGQAGPARSSRHEAELSGLRARALPAPRQRAPARAPARAGHPPHVGRLRRRDARLAVLAPRPARDAARPRSACSPAPDHAWRSAHAPTRLGAEGAAQRVVGRLAGLALDEHAPPAPGERLGRAVAAHVDAAARARARPPRRAGRPARPARARARAPRSRPRRSSGVSSSRRASSAASASGSEAKRSRVGVPAAADRQLVGGHRAPQR